MGYVGVSHWLKRRCATSQEYSYWMAVYWELRVGITERSEAPEGPRGSAP